LLRDLRNAETGTQLADHLWFRAGAWSSSLNLDDRIAFDARVTPYLKGYLGHREVCDRPVMQDWRLERPTKVQKLRPPPR
jgi:hypothetical protein